LSCGARPPALKPHPGSRVVSDVARVAVLIGLYLAAGIAFLIAVNEDQNNFGIPFLVVAGAAIVFGLATANLGWRGLALWLTLPWVLVLLGLPFQTTNRYTGGECCDDVSAVAVVPTLASVLLMLLAGGARALYERR
jgi:hypothetical protein